jgi:hypothetical protein
MSDTEYHQTEPAETLLAFIIGFVVGTVVQLILW